MQTLTLTRDFPLTLTVGQAEELRRLGILDVFEIATLWEQLKFIISDRSLMTRLVWEMTDKSRWQFESFQELLSGADQEEVLGAVTTVIVESFPPVKRPMIREVFASVLAAQNVAIQRMRDSLTMSDSQSESERTSDAGMEFGDLPGSLVVTRESLPSVNSTSWPMESSEQIGTANANCSL